MTENQILSCTGMVKPSSTWNVARYQWCARINDAKVVGQGCQTPEERTALTHLKLIPLRLVRPTMRVKKVCRPSLIARLVVQRSIHLVAVTNSLQLRHLRAEASSTRRTILRLLCARFNPYLAEWSPYHGAAQVTEATARLVAAVNCLRLRFSTKKVLRADDKQAERFGVSQ